MFALQSKKKGKPSNSEALQIIAEICRFMTKAILIISVAVIVYNNAEAFSIKFTYNGQKYELIIDY
jgi:hypothetical protein